MLNTSRTIHIGAKCKNSFIKVLKYSIDLLKL